jgi:hypothetical protein
MPVGTNCATRCSSFNIDSTHMQPNDDPMQRGPDLARGRAMLGRGLRVQVDRGLARTILEFDRLLIQPPARAAARALTKVAA